MGITLKRKKKSNFLLSVLYRMSKLPILSKKNKFKLFLDLEWIFERLAHEASFNYYSVEDHPLRTYSNSYILKLLKESDTVLDLGCHSGQITSVLATKAKQVVGIDYNKEAIDLAREKYKRPNLTFINDDVVNYLNTNRSNFDVLILSHILEHLEDPKQIVLNCKPFVNYMYIELPDFDKSYMNHYRKDLQRDLIYTDADHISEFDRTDIKQLIEACGFLLLESEYRFGVQRHWCKKENA
jgi:ubiquinone/menaquinone biosynthesis C-methylase UbiE